MLIYQFVTLVNRTRLHLGGKLTKQMIFVYLAQMPSVSTHDQIARLAGVVEIFDFGYHEQSTTVGVMPDFLVLVHGDANAVQECVEELCPGVTTYIKPIKAEQQLITEVPWWNDPSLPQPRDEISALITTVDIPGTVPARPAMKVASAPIITSVPGMPPSNSAVVHHQFSSQAGLASFGIGGLGHLGELVEL